MTHFTLSLATGAVAGALVVIPMIFQRCSARSCIASFLIYLFAAVMVFYGDLPYLPWWADGMGFTGAGEGLAAIANALVAEKA